MSLQATASDNIIDPTDWSVYDPEPPESQGKGKERARELILGSPEGQDDDNDWRAYDPEPLEAQGKGKERAEELSFGSPEGQDVDYVRMVNWAGNEGQSTEAQDEDMNKKGKGRARESNSKSPSPGKPGVARREKPDSKRLRH